jgi:hypothetical protein
MNGEFFPPMPDELVEAHAGRIGTFLAGPISEVQRHSLIRKLAEAVVPSVDRLPYSWQVAALSGKQRAHYVRQHSMLPAIGVVQSRASPSPFGAQRSSLDFRSGAALHVQRVHLCRACVREDLSLRPYSWFRRNHSLPGIEMCARHACPLEKVNAPDPWCRLPHQWLAGGATEPSGMNPNSRSECRFQVRLQETYRHFVGRERPYRLAQFHAFLKTRGRELEPEKSPYAMYSAIVSKVAPEAWLRRNCPEVDNLRIFDAIGSSITLPSHGFVYAVLLGAMFGTAEEFERSIARSIRTPSTDVGMCRLAA